MLKCLYLTDIKPSRKSAQQFTNWLRDNYPECTFTEFNVSKTSSPLCNRGRYQGRVDGPETWGDAEHAADRQAVFEAARRMLDAA
jgi:hypothetical protein